MGIILQYSLITLVVVGAFSVTLGITLTRRITTYQIDSHVRLFPAVVEMTVGENPRLSDFFAHPDPRNPQAEEMFRQFLSLGKVFRVKVWSTDAVVLWSNARNLIGQRFPDDEEFQDAVDGETAWEMGTLDKAENALETGRGKVLEIYTPVREEGRILGVLELYEADRDLFAQISRTTGFTWGLVVGAGVLLYGLLFAVYYRAHSRQKSTTQQLIDTQDATIFALAYQAELRDRQTGRHLERTARYVSIIAEELAGHPDFLGYLSAAYREDLVKSAPLHDIGKVGVPDSILLKPGPLTAEETEIMRGHCVLGARVLEQAESRLGFQSFLKLATQLCMGHHEKWDGSGYPAGAAGNDIPLSARIMAIADVYDALRSPRPYKEPFDHQSCVILVRKEAGRHFDPRVVEAFLRRQEDFRRVSEQLADEAAFPLAPVRPEEPMGAPSLAGRRS
jgi:HD-GYP domain-containing protein (c-di-GMP phosphodiesterase class II)